jgi:hypothetical protein
MARSLATPTLNTALAFGFGVTLTISLQTQTAEGYPAGAVVSTGVNPVVSVGGELEGTASHTPLTAPSDQGLLITDIVLTASDSSPYCRAHSTITIHDGGSPLATFAVGMTPDTRSYSNHQQLVPIRLSSGIFIAPGNTLTIETSPRYQDGCGGSTMEVEYTLSGYHTQP